MQPTPNGEKPPAAGIFANSTIATTIAICALIGLTAVCYFRSLSGYFLADDFIHIPWLFKVFHGHPELLLKNFVSNWMQTDGTQFYRPLISLTMAADYGIWGVNPIGYHLTNLAFEIGSTIFLYLACRRMFGRVVGFAAAALFAVSPLHAEVVSWTIARVDSVASTFYLAALWLFLRAEQYGRRESEELRGAKVSEPQEELNKSVKGDDASEKTARSGEADDAGEKTERRLPAGTSNARPGAGWKPALQIRALAVVAFVLSLLSKEIAVTLPAAMVLYCLLYPPPGSNLKSRFTHAAKSTAVFWLVLAVYMVVRTLALGTVSGGYGGSIGAGLSTSAYQRWFGDGSFMRIFFPLNELVFVQGDKTRHYLKLLYEIGAVIIALRVALLVHSGKIRRFITDVLFAAGWFVIVMLPAYQVFNLSTTLQGSRFIYLGTAPLALLLAILLTPDNKSAALSSKPRSAVEKSSRLVRTASGIVFAVMIVLFARIAYQNNEPWVQASAGVRALKEAIEQQFQNLPPDASIALLNLPQRFKGAHMIYNGAMFGILVQPPLCAHDYTNRVATFEPIMFGDSDLISVSRLRRMAADPAHYSIFYWDQNNQSLHSIANLRHVLNTDFIKAMINTHISPSAQMSYATPTLCATWIDVNGDQQTLSSRLQKFDGAHTARFAVSEHKSWLTMPTSSVVRFSIPTPGYDLTIQGVEEQNGKELVPQLEFQPQYLNSIGKHPVEDARGVTWTGSLIGPFHYDVSAIHNATHMMYELSKRDCWFDHYSGTLRDDLPAMEVTERGYLPKLVGDKIELIPTKVKQAGYYDFRIFAVDDLNQIVGYASDPVTLWVTPAATENSKMKRANK
jgi:hypothetical protein